MPRPTLSRPLRRALDRARLYHQATTAEWVARLDAPAAR
jgi:hypothetical protein